MPTEISARERRRSRILNQRQKIEALQPGSSQRVVEETILGTMLNSAAIGNLADSMLEASVRAPGLSLRRLAQVTGTGPNSQD